MTMNFKPYITRDPSICGGEPVITGTRITVRTTRGQLSGRWMPWWKRSIA